MCPSGLKLKLSDIWSVQSYRIATTLWSNRKVSYIMINIAIELPLNMHTLAVLYTAATISQPTFFLGSSISELDIVPGTE